MTRGQDDAPSLDAAIHNVEQALTLLREGRRGPFAADGALLAKAKHLYAERRRRERVFDADLFREPAWDMLLDLFINQREGVAVSVSSATIGAGVPTSTGLRLLGEMEARGFVRRVPDAYDRRRINVMLTDDAQARLEEYLALA